MKDIYLSTQTTLVITLVVGAFFIALGYINLKKISDNKKSHIVGDRNESVFSLTTSLSASALGAWILFGPASAATWGGIGGSNWICVRYCRSYVIFIQFWSKN